MNVSCQSNPTAHCTPCVRMRLLIAVALRTSSSFVVELTINLVAAGRFLQQHFGRGLPGGNVLRIAKVDAVGLPHGSLLSAIRNVLRCASKVPGRPTPRGARTTLPQEDAGSQRKSGAP